MSDLTLITCTGDRHQAFALCDDFIRLQSINDYKWIVVDDGIEPTKLWSWHSGIRLEPLDDPRESFRRNMLTALRAVETDKVMFIEDDDCYHNRTYIELWSALLDKYELVGEARAKYYHVGHRMYWTHPNTRHASLCQTGIRGRRAIEKCIEYLEKSPHPETLDGGIWKRMGMPDGVKCLLPCSTHVVGIKGMPGRKGLGIHHWTAEKLAEAGYQYDPELFKLEDWAGGHAFKYEDFEVDE